MTPKSAFVRWALLGALTASILIAGQAREVGGLNGLLQVGANSEVRPLIESQLGEVPVAPGSGHDGQIYYAIALDLRGQEVPELLDDPSYRYRRILYPAVASGFGLLEGSALLYGMILVSVAATALASGGVAAIAVQYGRSDWLGLAVLLNPGVWLSIRLLTADVLAISLMIAGLALVSKEARLASGAFGFSALAKDVFVATPLALWLSRTNRRTALLLSPLFGISLWILWLSVKLGSGPSPRGNLDWPLFGIIEASSTWPSLGPGDLFYLVYALVSVAVGLLVGIGMTGWFRWPLLAWSGLALISSDWVWDFGNNAARVFAPIAILLAIHLVSRQAPQPNMESKDSI